MASPGPHSELSRLPAVGELPAPETLRCFVEVAQQLSFRGAARAVALTPAAVGQRIRQLEQQVGARLFHRTTRRVSLSSAGKALLPLARDALGASQACLEISPQPTRPVDLTLGTRHELGLSWLAPMLPKLGAVQDGLTLHLYFGSGADLVRRVFSGDIDCAVTSTRLTEPQIDFCVLHREDYGSVATPRLLRSTPLASAKDAASHTIIDTEPGLPLFNYWRQTSGAFDSMAFGRIRHMGTIDAIRYVLLRHQGVAVLPRYFVERDLKQGRLRVVMPRVKPQNDWFRLVFRRGDERRHLFERLAAVMMGSPLR